MGMYTVLYVEEEERIREQVKAYRFWQESEFSLKKVADRGAAALALLEKEDFDVVIADIRLPSGKGKGTFAESVRQMNYSGALVLLGSSCSFEAAREGMHLGALDFIPRPVGERKLMEVLTGSVPELERRRALKAQGKQGGISERQMEVLYGKLLGKEDGGEGLKKYMEEIVNLLEKKYPREEQRKEAVFQIFQELYRRIGREFPWLLRIGAAVMEEWDGKKKEKSWKEDVFTSLDQLEGMVKRFHLDRIDGTVNRILEGMAAHLGEGACLVETADELELSRDYVRILFKQRMNMGQNEYLTMMRMEYGKSLLNRTNLKVYQVAERTGYGTIDYFSRLFKAYTGMTPARFRREG